jgi:hypothetical protein
MKIAPIDERAALWRVFVTGSRVLPEEEPLHTLGSTLFLTEVRRVSVAPAERVFTIAVVERGALALVYGESVEQVQAQGDWALAERAVLAMGGAGMDVLLARSKRVWRLTPAQRSLASQRAVAIVAGVLVQSELSPALLPDESRLVGLRGVRQWLDTLSE